MKSIIVITKDDSIGRTIQSCLASQSLLAQAEDIESAITALQKKRYDFVFIDLEILSQSAKNNEYKEIFLPFWTMYPTLEIVIICSQNSLREAVRAVKAGANTYLTYPINPEEFKLIIDSIYDYKIMESELDYLREQFWQPDALNLIQTKSPAMQQVYAKIRAVAPTKTTVLLTGETGTGKGVLANLIHQHSSRRDKQFIPVHCGAIPDTLLESELFGHEKGSFTGADRRKLGKFEIANEGTIFLDEIGTITPSAQIKLLQILQDQTFQRVGGEIPLKTDVRIIAATNSDLEKMCEEGLFRRDLYYRLNVFPIEIPPLQKRKEDIPYLANVILDKMNKMHLKQIRGIHPRVIQAFNNYDWPGNIRELENLIERAYILENTSTLIPDNFPNELFETESHSTLIRADSGSTLSEVREKAIADIEKHYLKNLLADYKGRINDSAASAGISTRQLHKLMTKYGIRKEEFKK
jgi:DNA-binding NtrC family response regulator